MKYPLSHPSFAFRDVRGTIVNVLSGPTTRHVALITCERGSVRGNHYHPRAGGVQYVYVLLGALSVILRELSEDGEVLGETLEFVAVRGDLVRLDPYMAHAFRAMRPTMFLALDEYPATPNVYEQVTRPFKLVETD